MVRAPTRLVHRAQAPWPSLTAAPAAHTMPQPHLAIASLGCYSAPELTLHPLAANPSFITAYHRPRHLPSSAHPWTESGVKGEPQRSRADQSQPPSNPGTVSGVKGETSPNLYLRRCLKDHRHSLTSLTQSQLPAAHHSCQQLTSPQPDQFDTVVLHHHSQTPTPHPRHDDPVRADR